MPDRMLTLSLVLALLPAIAAPALADDNENGPRLIEDVLDIDDVSVQVSMRLPGGWRHALEYGHTLTAYSPAGGGRALSVTADPNETLLALGVPEFPLFADDARVESWAGDFAGHPARFYRGRGNERNHVTGLDQTLEGTRLVVHLDSCIGSHARPVVAVARSAEAFESLRNDPYLAPLVAMVTLALPDEVQPCDDDLTDGMRATNIDPPPNEGWMRRDAMGMAVSLPRRFDWHDEADGGFLAQDRSLPDDWFMSVFAERLDHGDAWRDDLPGDADIRALTLDDEALAERFAASRVAFTGDDGEGHAIILAARAPDDDGRYPVLVMLSLGQPGARAQPLMRAMLERLDPAG